MLKTSKMSEFIKILVSISVAITFLLFLGLTIEFFLFLTRKIEKLVKYCFLSLFKRKNEPKAKIEKW